MATASEGQGQKRALIISISEYDKLDPLDFCERDGNKMYDVLFNLGYTIQDQYKLIGGKIKYLELHDAIINFFQDGAIDPKDTVLFYFSGHGVLGEDGEHYLSTSEIDPDKPRQRGLPFDTLSKVREDCNSKTIFTILDCCYSGADRPGGKGEDASANAARNLIEDKSKALGEGKCILAACKPTQKAYEYKEQGHSYFTFYLAEALTSKECIDPEGDVTPELVTRYIDNKIRSLTEDIRPKQTPLLDCRTSGKIILARNYEATTTTAGISPEPVHKRQLHTFLSRAYVNKTIADNLYEWLRIAVRDAESNEHLYYHKPEPGVEKSTILQDLIPKCRSIIILLSGNSLKEGWVKEEYRIAKDHKQLFSDFKIIPVLIEECEIPEDLSRDLGDSLIVLSEGRLDLETSKEILERIYYRQRIGPGPEQANDLYISRGWREEEKLFAEYICALLDKAGFRLIGDAEDQEEYDVSRVKSIISSCGGFVAILPHRGEGKTSKYIIHEIDIAQSLQLPSLIIADPNVNLKKKLTERSIQLQMETAKGTGHEMLQKEIRRIREEWKSPPNKHYVFFATDLDDVNEKRREVIRDHLQLITSMSCKMAPDYKYKLHESITEKITGAHLVISDISDNNLNTMIEAGIALGANTNLRLLARRSTGGKMIPPYMLNDIQIEDYTDDKELLQKVHRIAYEYRRRILNYELDSRK